MMLQLFIVGSMLSAPSAEAASLYENIRSAVISEYFADTIPDDIADYVAAVLMLDTTKTWTIEPEDIVNIAKGSVPKICNADNEPGSSTGCHDLMRRAGELIEDELRVRRLGDALQSVATGLELPLSELPNRPLQLPRNMSAITALWGAGAGDGNDIEDNLGNTVRTATLKPDTVVSELKEIFDAFAELSPEEKNAALWRYSSGVRLVKGDRAPQFPAPIVLGTTDSERQYLVKRWERLENALDALLNTQTVQDIKSALDPPLMGDDVLYIDLPRDVVQSGMGENILLWIRLGRTPALKIDDIGLTHDVALNPVYPSLLKDSDSSPLRGGTYPPETVNSTGLQIPGRQLCSWPQGQLGFLCRAFETDNPQDLCPGNGSPTDITLVSCLKSSSEKTTISGPDVCEGIDWNSVTGDKAICEPGNAVPFLYRIGNTLCYIGRCTEDSLERSRLTPARATVVTGEEFAAFDSPLAGLPLATVLSASTTEQTVLPRYNPKGIVAAYEYTLCQQRGLPILTPSFLCEPSRTDGFSSPVTNLLFAADKILTNQQQAKTLENQAQHIAENLGIRIGGNLYATYLRSATRNFAGTVTQSSQLLSQLSLLRFPDNMCPLGTP